MVKDHKLKTGKLADSDPLENKLMKKLVSNFKKDITAYGAGDQLVCVFLCFCVYGDLVKTLVSAALTG